MHTADVLAAKVAHLTETGRISKQSRILFVDDGSKDDTWSIIRNLHERDAHLFGGVSSPTTVAIRTRSSPGS